MILPPSLIYHIMHLKDVTFFILVGDIMRYQAKMTEASLHQNPFLISNCFISFRNQVSTFRSLALWPNLWRKTARSLAMIEASSDYPWTCWVHPHMGQKSKQIRSDPIYLYLSLSITIYHYLSLSITIYHYLWIYTKDIYTILLYYNIYIYISILHSIYIYYTYWHALFLSYDHCRQQHETLIPNRHSFGHLPLRA